MNRDREEKIARGLGTGWLGSSAYYAGAGDWGGVLATTAVTPIIAALVVLAYALHDWAEARRNFPRARVVR